MSAMFATVVDWQALGETVGVALVAGVGITAVFSLAILGAAVLGEARRDGRGGTAVGLTVVALAACGAAIAVGILVMTSK
jgi:hypothetical protein